MEIKIPDLDKEIHKNLIAKYQKAQIIGNLVDSWRHLFVDAALRLSTWLRCMHYGENLDDAIKGEPINNDGLEWISFIPSVEYLLNIALSESKIEGALEFLLDFNNELSADENSVTIRIDNDQIFRNLYQWLRQDKYALIASLSLFDIHVSRYDETKIIGNCQERPLELIPNIFTVLAEGLNIWALRRRWLRIYYDCSEKEELKIFSEKYALGSSGRERATNILLSEFKEEFPGTGFHATAYKRTLSGLYKSGLNEDQIINAIFLSIICPTIKDCYQALFWLDKHGPVQTNFIRKSLLHPEPNGATRLQTAILMPPDGRLLVARIGTVETHRNNEWGKLLRLLGNPKSSLYEDNQINNLPIRKTTRTQIKVYDITGSSFCIEKNSTVADFILQTRNLDEAQLCSGTFVNATEATLGHKLIEGDVLRVLIGHTNKDIRTPDDWQGDHQLPNTYNLIDVLKKRERANVDRGRNRLIILLQEYLRPWNITPDEKDLLPILTAVGYTLTKSTRDNVFRSLVTDKSKDRIICQIALQFYLRGRILYPNGEPIQLHWKDIRIAQCCEPKLGNDIVGTKAFGPHNTNDPRYGIQKEIVIHQTDCSMGPSSRNIINLVWASDSTIKNNYWGLQASFLIDDDRGALGEFMDLIYEKTSLEARYVHADAVNYGYKKAQIVMLATAATKEEIQDARTEFNNIKGNKTYKELNPRDARELIPQRSYCPYILTSDPEMGKDTPIMMIGRQREISQLKTYINDPRINKIMVVGYFRTGKTWFLKHFKSTYNLPGRYSIYISFDVPPSKMNPKYIAYDIYRQALLQFDEYGLKVKSDQRPQNLYILSDWFNEITKANNCQLNLLFDEFSGVDLWIKEKLLESNFTDQFIRFMRDTHNANFVLVFQSAHINNLIEDHSGFTDYYRTRISEGTIDIKPFSTPEIFELLNRPVQDLYSVSENAVSLAMLMTGGNPFLAAKLGKMLWENSNLMNLHEIDVDKLQDIFMDSYLNDPDWGAFIDRIVQKITEVPLNLLKHLAIKQYENWQGWPFQNDAWVLEKDIASSLLSNDFNFDDMHVILEKLKYASLVSCHEEGDNTYWKLNSSLVAFRLANVYIHSQHIGRSDVNNL